MGFYRQLDLLLPVLVTLLVFASCTFLGGLPVRTSLFIAVVVLLAGLQWRE
jgi:hypothetical protein